MLVFGGEAGDALFNELFSLDISTLMWTRVDYRGVPPSPRSFHSFALMGRYFAVFGGRTSTGLSNTTHFLDVVRWEWQLVSVRGSLPSGRSHHFAQFTRSGDLVLFGGRGNTGSCFDVFTLAIEYSTRNDSAPLEPAFSAPDNAFPTASITEVERKQREDSIRQWEEEQARLHMMQPPLPVGTPNISVVQEFPPAAVASPAALHGLQTHSPPPVTPNGLTFYSPPRRAVGPHMVSPASAQHRSNTTPHPHSQPTPRQRLSLPLSGQPDQRLNTVESPPMLDPTDPDGLLQLHRTQRQHELRGLQAERAHVEQLRMLLEVERKKLIAERAARTGQQPPEQRFPSPLKEARTLSPVSERVALQNERRQLQEQLERLQHEREKIAQEEAEFERIKSERESLQRQRQLLDEQRIHAEIDRERAKWDQQKQKFEAAFHRRVEEEFSRTQPHAPPKRQIGSPPRHNRPVSVSSPNREPRQSPKRSPLRALPNLGTVQKEPQAHSPDRPALRGIYRPPAASSPRRSMSPRGAGSPPAISFAPQQPPAETVEFRQKVLMYREKLQRESSSLNASPAFSSAGASSARSSPVPEASPREPNAMGSPHEEQIRQLMRKMKQNQDESTRAQRDAEIAEHGFREAETAARRAKADAEKARREATSLMERLRKDSEIVGSKRDATAQNQLAMLEQAVQQQREEAIRSSKEAAAARAEAERADQERKRLEEELAASKMRDLQLQQEVQRLQQMMKVENRSLLSQAAQTSRPPSRSPNLSPVFRASTPKEDGKFVPISAQKQERTSPIGRVASPAVSLSPIDRFSAGSPLRSPQPNTPASEHIVLSPLGSDTAPGSPTLTIPTLFPSLFAGADEQKDELSSYLPQSLSAAERDHPNGREKAASPTGNAASPQPMSPLRSATVLNTQNRAPLQLLLHQQRSAALTDASRRFLDDVFAALVSISGKRAELPLVVFLRFIRHSGLLTNHICLDDILDILHAVQMEILRRGANTALGTPALAELLDADLFRLSLVQILQKRFELEVGTLQRAEGGDVINYEYANNWIEQVCRPMYETRGSIEIALSDDPPLEMTLQPAVIELFAREKRTLTRIFHSFAAPSMQQENGMTLPDCVLFAECFELIPKSITAVAFAAQCVTPSMPHHDSAVGSNRLPLPYFYEVLARLALIVCPTRKFNASESVTDLFYKKLFLDDPKRVEKNLTKRGTGSNVIAAVQPLKLFPPGVPEERDGGPFSADPQPYADIGTLTTEPSVEGYHALVEDPPRLKDELERIYVFYCAGGSAGDSKAELLTETKLCRFLADCQLLDTPRSHIRSTPQNDSAGALGHPLLAKGDVDAIFHRVWVDAYKAAAGAKVADTSVAALNFPAFMSALNIIAPRIWAHESTSQSLLHLLLANILPLAQRLPTRFSVDVGDTAVTSLCAQSTALPQLFQHYAASRRPGSGEGVATSDFLRFAADFEVVPRLLSHGELLRAALFELMRNTDPASMQLLFPSFVDTLVRCAHLAFSRMPFVQRFPTLVQKVRAFLERLGLTDASVFRAKVESLGRRPASPSTRMTSKQLRAPPATALSAAERNLENRRKRASSVGASPDRPDRTLRASPGVTKGRAPSPTLRRGDTPPSRRGTPTPRARHEGTFVPNGDQLVDLAPPTPVGSQLAQPGSPVTPSRATAQLGSSPQAKYPVPDVLSEEVLDEALKEVFLFYASFGSNGTRDKLSGAAYAKMCRDARITNAQFPSARVDLVYSEAVKGHQNTMTFSVFCDSLLHLASKKFRGQPVPAALRRLLVEHVLPFAERARPRQYAPQLREALGYVQLYDSALTQLFEAYRGEQLGLSKDSLCRMMQDFGVSPDLLGERDVVEIVSWVNTGELDNLLQYSDFQQAIAACCLKAFANNPQYPTSLDKVDVFLGVTMQLRDRSKLHSRLLQGYLAQQEREVFRDGY
eukprot:TRINITY_DN4720_c0_g1_i1.p1 TRINITY_DN4720_c0_g1~~TRINITY_DN4720_c0_g1_i1.p1  ORF type:complete len:2192 (+),score=294.62 TRINITY_DN4720_c0_g1_i1:771-6578(+)